MMIKETALRDALMAAINSSRSNYIMIAAMLNELAAVRETVRGLDPTFADVLAQKQAESAAATAQEVQQIVFGYDTILERFAS
jgi:hypothetical protein